MLINIYSLQLLVIYSAKKSAKFSLCYVCTAQSLIPEFLLKERLDAETLENMGLVQSKVTFQQKYVKTKTKL